MDGVTFEEYVNVDDGTYTTEYPTDEDILANILNDDAIDL